MVPRRPPTAKDKAVGMLEKAALRTRNYAGVGPRWRYPCDYSTASVRQELPLGRTDQGIGARGPTNAFDVNRPDNDDGPGT